MLSHRNRIRRQRGKSFVFDIEENCVRPTGPDIQQPDWGRRVEHAGNHCPDSIDDASPGAAHESALHDNAIQPVRRGLDAAGASGASRNAATVLVGSASESLIRTLQRIALAIGLTLAVSPDGLHTVMNAIQRPPALIILDPEIPGVDAETVERRLARDSRTSLVPIIQLPYHAAVDQRRVLRDGRVT